MQTKSDAEPWWFLEGWEEDVIEQWTFSEKETAFAKYVNKIQELSVKYPKNRIKKGTQIAFWNEDEILFCESCDDDLQIYHGLLIMYNNSPYAIENKSNEDQLIRQAFINEKV
ncbi:DUF1033 family protein [Jeotgalibacillus soli]|nr:DUF1033 family protein [Jeotgalibacillus soli]